VYACARYLVSPFLYGKRDLLYQVHDDILTEPEDVQTMYDNIPVAEKKLRCVEGTKARWDGYLEFQRRPGPMLEWFESHMA
jgi:uncharacterized protein